MDDPAVFSGAPGKRGRKQGLADRDGAVGQFAHDLGMLKIEAGDPSYEHMRAQLGARASKSALSAAARGRELPSWETTWEFVRCLTPDGTDLEDQRERWQARWEAARGAARRPSDAVAREPASPPRSPGRRGRRWLALPLLAGVMAAAGLLWLVVRTDGLPAPPLDGDAVAFVADVTVPDGTTVASGERFVKTWELRNTGTVRWTGRFLQRLPDPAGAGCRTVPRVAVPETAPGRSVRVSVTVEAPLGPATCTVRWKMVDGQGRPFFPGNRPLFFAIEVAA